MRCLKKDIAREMYRELPTTTGVASGRARKFVGGSGPGGGVAEVEAAGGVEGVFSAAAG